jgi:hypothetical protein
MYMHVDFDIIKFRFKKYVCMYMYVDFDIIKCRLCIYMCIYMDVDFDIIKFFSTYIYMYVHVCGFRYYQICFYIYMSMYIHVDFDIIKFVSTYICICITKLDNIEVHILVHTHMSVETNLMILKSTCMYIHIYLK